MARDYNKQTLWSYNGLAFDFGHQTFSTTDATLKIYTGLDVIKGFTITPVEAMTTPETFTISGINGTSVTAASIVNGEMRTDNGYVTITRAVPTNTAGAYSPYTLRGGSGGGDQDTTYASTNDWADVPIGLAHTAGKISRVSVYQKTSNATAGSVLLGNIIADGTKDADKFIAAAKAKTMPASGKYISLTAAADFTSQTVAAGDYIIFGTSGAGAIGVGLNVEVTITPTAPVLTSALDIYYMFWGY